MFLQCPLVLLLYLSRLKKSRRGCEQVVNSPIALCRLMNLLSEQAARDVICENTLTTRANWSFNDNGAPFRPGTS
jgi:hypothetical protein